MLSRSFNAVLLLAVALLAANGCVQRRLMVRSNPPGAMVYVDDQPIGHTPVSVPFTYYGTRNFRVIKDGYETVTQLHNVPAPWYQYPPIDFVSENLVPWEIRDERIVDFTLVPQRLAPEHELLGRAESLRQRTMQGFAAPLPPQPAAPPNPNAPPPGAPFAPQPYVAPQPPLVPGSGGFFPPPP